MASCSYCVSTYAWSNLELRQLESAKSRMRKQPPNGTSGLGRYLVSGFSRRPVPPPRTKGRVFAANGSLTFIGGMLWKSVTTFSGILADNRIRGYSKNYGLPEELILTSDYCTERLGAERITFLQNMNFRKKKATGPGLHRASGQHASLIHSSKGGLA